MNFNLLVKSLEPFSYFFLGKIMNIAMSPELHSPTVTDMNTLNIYNKKMKKDVFICMPNISPDELVEGIKFSLLLSY